MENDFNLRKFLVENKLTTNSRLIEGKGTEYLKKAHQEFYDSDPENLPNPADVMYYIGSTETDEVDEQELDDELKQRNWELKQITEYQFEEDPYNFSLYGGAGEYESSIVIQQIKDDKGEPVIYNGYSYLGTTDRGSLTGTLVMLNQEHVNILKSIADIFNTNTGKYTDNHWLVKALKK